MNRSHAQHDLSPNDPRRGIATLWLILALPVFLILFGFLVEIANLWLARVELKNALDASSLAAVQHWSATSNPGNPSDTLASRQVGVSYAQANTIIGQPLVLDTNFLAGGVPNQNASCAGDLVYGAVDTTDLSNIVFDANVRPSCELARVRFDVTKPGSGVLIQPRMIGVFYEAGSPNLFIRRISFTMPSGGLPPAFQSHWLGFNIPFLQPAVSIFNSPDALNLNNNVSVPVNPPFGSSTNDVRGLNPSATNYSPFLSQFLSNWDDPNGNGDISFEASNTVLGFGVRYRTLTVHFQDNTFNPPGPNIEFVRFGAATNQIGEFPPYPNGINDGDSFGNPAAPVQIQIEFVNSVTMQTEICNTVFVDTGGNNGQSTAVCVLSSNQSFGVRAQKTVNVDSVFSDLFGLNFGSYQISARSDAMFNCDSGSPRLVHIETFNCVGP